MTFAISDRLETTFETSRFAGFGDVSNSRPHRHLRANPPILQTGPPLAISNLPLGGAVPLPRSKGRGGARNRADRESEALTTKQVANLIAATAHARAIGLPFTRMITIHWQSAGVPLAKMVWATGRFVDLLCKAIARFGSRTAWLWVHEGGREKGGHCHLLAYVPAAFVARLKRLQMRWLRLITDRSYKNKVIHSKPIGGRLGLEISNPQLHAANLVTALSYHLKGLIPEQASGISLPKLEPGGRVIGKRCGTSQNIGRKAQSLIEGSLTNGD